MDQFGEFHELSDDNDSISSNYSKLNIKSDKVDTSSDDDDSDTGYNKHRKTRVTKPNELESFGFNSELTWNFPKMTKYLCDKLRTPTSICPVNYMNDLDNYEIGYILSFSKGAKEESILFITNFKPEWLTDSEFNNYICTFCGKTSKSSRLVIIHSSAKAWGAKKVVSANTTISNLITTIKTNGITLNKHTIKFNRTGHDDELLPTQLLQPKSKSLSSNEYFIKEVSTEVTQEVTPEITQEITQELTDLFSQFQEQMDSVHRNYLENIKHIIRRCHQSR
jgi:hypothetical protein